MFLKNRNISSKIKRSKVTEYAALSSGVFKSSNERIHKDSRQKSKQRPANYNESNSSITNKVHDTHLMLLAKISEFTVFI